MNKYVSLFVVPFIFYASQCFGDDVDEAAKCAATFRVFNQIGLVNEELANELSKHSMLFSDLTQAYSYGIRNVDMNNGEKNNLITNYMYILDDSSVYENSFLKYLSNCMGWLVELKKVVKITQVPDSNIYNFNLAALLAGPRPNETYEYPFPDTWHLMEGLFKTSYVIWETMGKLNPKEITTLMMDGKLTFEEWEGLLEKAKQAVSSDAFLK